MGSTNGNGAGEVFQCVTVGAGLAHHAERVTGDFGARSCSIAPKVTGARSADVARPVTTANQALYFAIMQSE